MSFALLSKYVATLDAIVSALLTPTFVLNPFSPQNAPGKTSATFDGWTSGNMTAYIAVTVHWIDDQWKLCSGLLSFEELAGSHTGANMATHLAQVFKAGMGLDKVCSIYLNF